MRVFLDANVLFSATISPSGASAGLVELARVTSIQLVTSPYAKQEADRNLQVKASTLLHRWETIQSLVHEVPEANPKLLEKMHVALPDKDLPILAAAIACGSSLLVTGDARHFGQLFRRTTGATLILPPKDALEVLLDEEL